MGVKRRVVAVVFSVVALVGAGAEAGAQRKDREPADVARPVAGGPVAGAPELVLVADDGGDRATGTGDFVVQAVNLPFNFSFDFTTSLASRTFWPSLLGRACVSLRGTGSTDSSYWWREVKVEMWNAFGSDTRIGSPVRFSLNGSYHGYCWNGLVPLHEHYFRITKDWNAGARVWGNGWASAS
ncbi:hypothetical protein [Actinokineospora iranica]|uniref:Uncharacterized protein n=1 Tax=Actinokineospora iranica TaxID=1271860 RepID=A0A1G6UYK8_9PSEU|nr:hypothetical protein [Actinokineospora iranica]SDD45715.1 hypothetical protein SAMN05216174_111126 [Actinokineospora iranica]